MTIPKALLARRKVPPVVLRLRRQYTLRRWNGKAHEAILQDLAFQFHGSLLMPSVALNARPSVRNIQFHTTERCFIGPPINFGAEGLNPRRVYLFQLCPFWAFPPKDFVAGP